MKVAFVTDSGTGIAPSKMMEKGIYSLPLQIECEGVSYDEYETIAYSTVIENLHAQKLMKTSLPKLGKIQDMFEEIKNKGYDAVFCVPICKGLSGTMDAMEMIANQVGLKFYGVDCYVTAVLQERMIEIAKEMYEANVTVEKIMERLERMAETWAATLGGLLKIKPVLHINKDTAGKVDVMDKVRTMSKAQDKVIEHLRNIGVNKDYTMVVAHVDVAKAAKEYAAKIESRIEGSKVKIIDLVSAVGIHTGLGCLAVQVFNENV